jgi:ubiquinone/menaquinone biosynthesis C-methylase UbiE
LSGTKIVKADIHNLPFKDKEFDFVHCHDLLEHVDNPNKACSELIRIGKRGHIRTSTELFERLYGRPYHKWVCRYENNILIFKRKPKDFKENFGDFFDRLYRDNIEFKEITHRNMNLFFVEFEWKIEI